MRADRLVSILLLLQTHGRMSARQLSRRLEVSARTIHRDMEALGSAGVPVVADRGARGGWSLLNGYRANVSGLNDAEVRALFAAAPPRLLADLQLGEASDRALIKLVSALDPANRRTAEIMRQRLHIDIAGWRSSSEPVPHLVTLQEGVWRERRVRVLYGDDCEAERLLSPLGLVAKGAVWYVVAGAGDEIRTYRVSRVRQAFLTEETFDRPAGFDLARYWEESSARFKALLPRYEVVARMPAASVRWLRSMIRFGAIDRVSEEAGGQVRVDMHFDAVEVARAVLLGQGEAVEILEPSSLREEILAAARAIAARSAGG
ncbi:MAG TPA: WYL domain-containing protein [Thermoanaerobaculia bacterium]|nr:WYL domain-containing protein [Thermoanaerobaculia bacterium]